MADARSYIEEIPMWTREKHTLEEVRDFLNDIGNPQEHFQAVHVAGTNGKGSVCAFLTSILMEAGYTVGTFISPHLERVEERFLLDGQMVGTEDFQKSFDQVYEVASRWKEQGKGHPSYFEFLFYMAMDLFARKNVQIGVIETGMGGRLDATNALRSPLACAITSISLDHTRYLGDTIPKIAWEKAGIIKPQVPVIYDSTDMEAAQVIENRARELGARAVAVSREDYRILEGREARPGAHEARKDGFQIQETQGNLKLWIPFPAAYQAQNAMIAVKTARILNERALSITQEQIIRGVEHARWPGRMERIGAGFYLDGAHNPGGVAAFEEAAFHLSRKNGRPPCLLFGVMEDKDYTQMARILCRRIPWKAVGLVQADSQRGATASALEEAFAPVYDGELMEFSSPKEGAEAMEELRAGGLVFCAGSLYMAGQWKQALSAMRIKE